MRWPKIFGLSTFPVFRLTEARTKSGTKKDRNFWTEMFAKLFFRTENSTGLRKSYQNALP